MTKLPHALILMVAMTLTACGSPGITASSPSASTGGRTPAPSASTTGASPMPSAAVACADRILAGMSEDQRIGQLFLLGLASDRLGSAEIQEIQGDHVGSVWFVDRTYAGEAGVRSVSDAVQAQATAGATANVHFFVAANQEGGITQALQGPGFSVMPSALVQGGWTTAAVASAASTWGQQLQAAGVNMNFAPVMDVVPPGFDSQNQPIGALQREYGHDPATAGSHATAFLQAMRQAGVAVTAKHFPGLGRVTGNTDYTTATDTVTTINDPYLQSFKQGIDGGADFVMIAIATYTRIDPSHLAAFSPLVIGQMLRGTMGFTGVVVSDDLGATVAVAAIPAGDRAISFLAAGGDLVTSKTTGATHAMVLAVRSKVAADTAFRTVVDQAALRVLREKQARGLLPC
ncbi:MAG: glycoside hydrolase family 3 protein [Chloroflexi bacterium]|nr:MAG: glycoside hydrolase family 3 protein [Chloroflexota bacterium]TME48326.1 MAG: glycoside hydrolase family 3 protein [Chloroflexota bacterium]